MLILIAVLQAVIIVLALIMIVSMVQINSDRMKESQQRDKDFEWLKHKVDYLERKIINMEVHDDNTGSGTQRTD